MKKLHLLAALLPVLLAAALPAQAAMKDAAHPFILWDKADVAAVRQKIEREPWAKAAVQKLEPKGEFNRGEPFINLFKYAVLEDEKAGEAERKALLSFINAPLNQRAPDGLDLALRYDNTLHALRYDALYDSLTPEQRQKLEDKFREFIDRDLAHDYRNTRHSNLPNMQLVRLFASHIMAVAIKDEERIRKLHNHPSGFRWYFEDYLSDGQFYNEEFAKMTSLMGQFLLYARGLDRLGLPELGFDFKGRNGGSIRSYFESYLTLGYPATDLPGGRPAFARVSMGDTRGGDILQHTNFEGISRNAQRDVAYFYGSNMNGRDHRGHITMKLSFPQWFEILAARYPDGPYAWFLTQMRPAGEEAYTPTLFWGLNPIQASAVKAPPAPSGAYQERGFAMLRANETPDYWTSADPAVALQFAQLYVHYTADCFALLGYHAFNRPIYVNRAISAGYNGGPWDFHLRGHAGVVVDNLQAQPVGEVKTFHHFSPLAKFVHATDQILPGKGLKGRGEVRSSDQPRDAVTEVYPGIAQSRTLVLTRDYLVDVYNIADKNGTPRDFHWLVHAPGSHVPEQGQQWQPSDALQESLFRTPWVGKKRTPEEFAKLPIERRQYDSPETGDSGPDWVKIDNARQLTSAAGEPVAITTLQTYHGKDVNASRFGPEWYDRKIGVRLRMLPQDKTTAYVFDTPVAYQPGFPRAPREKDQRGTPEFGGVSVAMHRKAPATTFITLHEPFENGTPPKTTFRTVSRGEGWVIVAVEGTGRDGVALNDRVLVELHPKEGRDYTVTGSGQSFTFQQYAFLRLTPEAIHASGNLVRMTMKVQGNPKLILNGKEVPVSINEGVLTYAPKPR